MMMRFLAGHRPQRVPFLCGQIRQMTDESDDFPISLSVSVWAEGRHQRHPDAMFDNPEEFSVRRVILFLAQRWCGRIEPLG